MNLFKKEIQQPILIIDEEKKDILIYSLNYLLKGIELEINSNSNIYEGVNIKYLNQLKSMKNNVCELLTKLGGKNENTNKEETTISNS